jgi:hypothetical protein
MPGCARWACETDTVKHPVTRFKSLRVGLKELEKFIRRGTPLYSGRPLKRFGGMLPREMVANWLVCAVINADEGAERLTFTSDPTGGDGVIYNTETEHTWPTEHVMVPRAPEGGTPDIKALLLKAVALKQEKGGAAYASGKTLILFLEAGGDVRWFPNQVAKALPKIDFDSVWVVGLQGLDDGAYVYGVTLLDASEGAAPTWSVRISPDFETWDVTRLQ